MKYLFGIFLLAHGLVHVLYAGQSSRIFELQPGMVWPDQSWLLSRVLASGAAGSVAAVGLAAACMLFLVGGAGVLFSQNWWRPFLVAAAASSSLVYLVLWDGRLHALPDQGAIGIAINVALVVLALIARRPVF